MGASVRSEEDTAALEAMAQTMRAHGVLQPLLVRGDGDGWVCLVGNRRLQAARLAGLETVPCQVVGHDMTDADVIERQIIENIHRKDLSPIEEAEAFRALLTLRGWSQRELARRLGIDQTTISKALQLLDLPPSVQQLVGTGQLPPSTALTVRDEPADVQEQEAQRMAEEGTPRSEARKRGKPQPKQFSLKTPGGWSVVVTALRAKATRAEMLTELEGLVVVLQKPQEGSRLAA